MTKKSKPESGDWVFTDVPVVIDPGCSSIELSKTGPDCCYPTVYIRSRDDCGLLPVPVNVDRVAIVFADKDTISKSKYALGYSRLGVLLYAFSKDERNVWHESPVPEETSGAVVYGFSVRVAFAEREEAEEFHRAVMGIANKTSTNVSFLPKMIGKSKAIYLVPVAETKT